jgi:hypothetical protein
VGIRVGCRGAHTCFNRLDLPPYEDYESLERKLRFAIECVFFAVFFFLRFVYLWAFVGRRKDLGRSEIIIDVRPSPRLRWDMYVHAQHNNAGSEKDFRVLFAPFFFLLFRIYTAPFAAGNLHPLRACSCLFVCLSLIVKALYVTYVFFDENDDKIMSVTSNCSALDLGRRCECLFLANLPVERDPILLAL